jgi:hypothetical protein
MTNMFIVIPQIIAASSESIFYKTYGTEHINAMLLVSLILAAIVIF